MPRLAGGFFVMMERRGKRAYAENPARVQAARAVADGDASRADRASPSVTTSPHEHAG
jgi:hypothetical protein